MEQKKDDFKGLSKRIKRRLWMSDIYTKEEFDECLRLKNQRFPLGLPIFTHCVGEKGIKEIEEYIGYEVEICGYNVPPYMFDRKIKTYYDYDKKEDVRVLRKSICN